MDGGDKNNDMAKKVALKITPEKKVVMAKPNLVETRTKLKLINDSVAQAKAAINGLDSLKKLHLDSMSEMGEMESLKLQMAMDRLSKMMSTLSNILKKISDTSSEITKNMK